MTKLKFLKKIKFFKILSKIYIKNIKKTNGEASGMNFLLSIFFYKAGQVGWETDLIVCSFQVGIRLDENQEKPIRLNLNQQIESADGMTWVESDEIRLGLAI